MSFSDGRRDCDLKTMIAGILAQLIDSGFGAQIGSRGRYYLLVGISIITDVGINVQLSIFPCPTGPAGQNDIAT